ncbi:MAG: multiheme c-type cytochrome [Rubrivivax sp.]
MDSNHASASAATWRTRATTVALARALITSLLLLMGSGLLLWLGRGHGNLVQWLLLLHLATAVLCLLFALPFVAVHLKDGREPLRRLLWPWLLLRPAWRGGFERKRLVGHALLWALLLLAASGLLVALPGLGVLAGRPWVWPLGTQALLLDLHRTATPLLLLGLPWHLWKLRRWTPRLLAGSAACAALLAGAVLLPAPAALPVPLPQGMPLYSLPFGSDPFAPGQWRTPGQQLVNWRAVPSATGCGSCHVREFMEWNTSMHAVADRDLLYDAAVQTNVTRTQAARRHGDEKGRWCESCHNPLGTLTGAVTPLRSVQETAALEEGVNCVVCHTASHARPQQGNGALQSNLDAVLHMRHPALLAAAPSRHARDMQAASRAPQMRDSALCGACHTEIRPTTVSGDAPMHFQDTYEEWRRSDYARRGVQCQHCHMAEDPAAAIGRLQRGEPARVRVSHRMPGANHLLTDPELPPALLHALRGGSPAGLNRQFGSARFAAELQRTRDQALGLLRAAARLDLRWLARDAAAPTLRVTVANAGAGHALPTGPLDQRHMWLEVEVRDAQGRLLLHSGGFDARRGQVDPQAVIWAKQMHDAQGRLDRRHLLFDVQRLSYTRAPIAPGQSQQVDYTLPTSVSAGAPLQVRARLWYRLAHQDLLLNIETTGAPVPEIIVPPVLMTEATLPAGQPS